MLEIAKQSEHARSFEVVGQLIKAGLDANEALMKLHKTKKELSAEKSGPTQVTNALFVGSTAELQKMLNKQSMETKKEKRIENETRFYRCRHQKKEQRKIESVKKKEKTS